MGNAILIGGQKGGTGKSTIATNLAVMSALMGHDTLIIDTDTKQFNAAKFIHHRQELGIEPTPSSIRLTGKIKQDIESQARRFKRVIIDAGGRDSIELRFAMTAECVSIMLSPWKTGEFDLETIEVVDDLVLGAQSINPNLEAYAIFTHVNNHPKDSLHEDAKTLLESFPNIKLCNIPLHYRVAYMSHASQALSLVEYEKRTLMNQPSYRIKPPKASLEMCQLYNFVFKEKFEDDFLNRFMPSCEVKNG